jgi:hypothetical protein
MTRKIILCLVVAMLAIHSSADSDDDTTEESGSGTEDGNRTFGQPFPSNGSKFFNRNIRDSNRSVVIDEYGKAEREYKVDNECEEIIDEEGNSRRSCAMINDYDVFNLFMRDKNGTIRNFGAEAKGSAAVRAFTEGREGEAYTQGLSEVNPVSNEDLRSRFPDSNLSKPVETIDNFVEDYRLRAYLNSDIECYVTRALNPFFQCSWIEPGTIPIRYGMDGSGSGDPKASIKEILTACESDCFMRGGCSKAKIVENVPTNDRRNYDAQLAGGEAYAIETEPTLRISTMVIGLYAQSADANKSDDNTSNKQDDNATIGYQRFNVGMERVFVGDKEKNETDKVHHSDAVLLAEIPLREGYNTISVPISNGTITSIITDFYKPDINGTVVLTHMTVKYFNNEHWFCNDVQTVMDADSCAGQAEIRMGGSEGATYELIVCRSADRDIGDDPITGGFYSQQSCLEECLVPHPCVPIYEDSGIQSYRINYGCVDSEANPNPNCSEKRCAELLDSNELIINERVLHTKNGFPAFENTIEYGLIKDGVERPKLDLLSEFRAAETGDYDTTFLWQEKDGAYSQMIDHRNYTLYPMIATTQSQSAVEARRSDDKRKLTIDWLLKPEARHVANNRDYYVYLVTEVEQITSPQTGTIYKEVTTVKEDSDTGKQEVSTSWQYVPAKSSFTKFKHRTFFSHDTSGKPIPIWHHQEAQIQRDKNGTTSWLDYSLAKTPQYVKLDSATGSYVSVTGETPAPYLSSAIKFDYSEPYKRIRAYDDLNYQLENQIGVLAHSQEPSTRALVFTGDITDLERGMIAFYRLHGFYSERPLSVKELHEKVSQLTEPVLQGDYCVSSAFGDPESWGSLVANGDCVDTGIRRPCCEIYAMGSDIYPNYIHGDGTSSGKVSMILQGRPTNITVWGGFRPDGDELHKHGFFIFY